MDDFTKFLFQSGLIIDIGESDVLNSLDLLDSSLSLYRNYDEDNEENEESLGDDEEEF